MKKNVISINFKKEIKDSEISKYFVSYVPIDIKQNKKLKYLIFSLNSKNLHSFHKVKTKHKDFDKLLNTIIELLPEDTHFFHYLYSFKTYNYDYYVIKNYFNKKYKYISRKELKIFLKSVYDLSIKSSELFLNMINNNFYAKKNLKEFDYFIIAIFTFGYIFLFYLLEEIMKYKKNYLISTEYPSIFDYNFLISDVNVKDYFKILPTLALIYAPIIYYVHIKLNLKHIKKYLRNLRSEKDKILSSINIFLNTLNNDEILFIIKRGVKLIYES